MNLEYMLQKLNLSEVQEAWHTAWEASCASFTPPTILHNLDLLREISTYCGLSSEEGTQCEECARRISRSEEMSLLFHHISRLVFDTPEYENQAYKELPKLPGLGDAADVFYLLLVLAAAVDIRAFHQEKNIPEEISRATLLDVKINTTRYARAHSGRLGIMRSTLPWFKTHNSRRLYRIGRLQFHVKPTGGELTVYRNRTHRQIVAFPPAGITYTQEGFWAVDGKEMSLQTNWVSSFVETEQSISGNPVLPIGHVKQEVVTLNKEEWDPILFKKQEVLDIHIPEGGGMTVEACISSMKEALPFFAEYFPEVNPVAFVCRSWIFSPQYKHIYRPDANFVLFQNEVFLFPVWSSGTEGLFFVFDAEEVDLQTIEPKTSLQKTMVSHLKNGGILRAGGMFFLAQDVEQLGKQYYLSMGAFEK